uniref:Uncharacterized protein n=1 Tax=Timema poppense TaxID=170557 RepID=A0A7R9HF48_TIMPO|nr:unnamed protein product [Timema poppensis]
MRLAAVTFDSQNLDTFSSPVASLVLTGSSQLTSDSQHLAVSQHQRSHEATVYQLYGNLSGRERAKHPVPPHNPLLIRTFLNCPTRGADDSVQLDDLGEGGIYPLPVDYGRTDYRTTMQHDYRLINPIPLTPSLCLPGKAEELPWPQTKNPPGPGEFHCTPGVRLSPSTLGLASVNAR